MNAPLALFAIAGLVYAAASGGPPPTAVRLRYRRRGWLPPAWLFELVWAALYACIAVAIWLFWMGRADGVAFQVGMYAMAANLVVNRYWTSLFFEHRLFWAALADLALIEATAVTFFVCACTQFWSPYHIAAAALTLPYMAWLAAAAVFMFAHGPV